jgi:hypothetical protein
VKVLTDGGFVTVQWGFFILGRIGETPNTRGHSIVGLLEMRWRTFLRLRREPTLPDKLSYFGL